MGKERYDNIEYNDEWQSVPVVRAEPVTYDSTDDEYDEEDENEYYTEEDEQEKGVYREFAPPKKENQNPQPVIKLQILLAVLAVAAAFALKSIGGDIYSAAKEWYFKNLNNSLVITLNQPTEGAESATSVTTAEGSTAENTTAPAAENIPTDIENNNTEPEYSSAETASSQENRDTATVLSSEEPASNTEVQQ